MSFGALIVEANLVVADGMPRGLGEPPARNARCLSGACRVRTWSHQLTHQCCWQPRSLGLSAWRRSWNTANEAAECPFKQKFPHGLLDRIAGTHCPPFGFQDDPKQMSIIIQALSDAKPDIVFVALGSPKQEKLINTLGPILPNAWWIGVGNSFSFLAGRVKRRSRCGCSTCGAGVGASALSGAPAAVQAATWLSECLSRLQLADASFAGGRGNAEASCLVRACRRSSSSGRPAC